MGLADVITDGITYARLQSGDIAVPNQGYKAAYAAILCFGVVATVLSLAYRLRNARLMRAHMHELGRRDRAVRASGVRRQLQQQEWELAQTHRTKVILSLSLLSVVVQGTSPLRLSADNRIALHGQGIAAQLVHRVCAARFWRGCRSAQSRLQVCQCLPSTAVSSSSTAFMTTWSAHSLPVHTQ